jgi:hypothetical protein
MTIRPLPAQRGEKKIESRSRDASAHPSYGREANNEWRMENSIRTSQFAIRKARNGTKQKRKWWSPRPVHFAKPRKEKIRRRNADRRKALVPRLRARLRLDRQAPIYRRSTAALA